MIVVTTADWEATTGRLCTLERVGARWVAVGKPIRVTVGRKGLGWGLGLHAAERPGPIKREGDKRAPAGIFRLESGFGVRALNLPEFDYRQTTENDFWVDDPGSEKYNRWVVSAEKDSGRDWRSAEILHRPDGIYDYVIVVGHNRDPIIPGRGSAIFLHAWFGEGVPTIGCTAMEESEVESLLKWLDREKHPVLVQVPDAELGALGLPVDQGVIRHFLENQR